MLKYILLSVVVLITFGSVIEGRLSDEDMSSGILSHEILLQNVDLSSQEESYCILSQRTSINTCLKRDNKKSKNNHRDNYKYSWLGNIDNTNNRCIIQEKYLNNNIHHIGSVDILTKFCRLII